MAVWSFDLEDGDSQVLRNVGKPAHHTTETSLKDINKMSENSCNYIKQLAIEETASEERVK
jgi:hypothetical protein